MEIDLLDAPTEQLQEMKSLTTVMFGGFGEPTFHKDILYMIGRVKALGFNVEMTTNGTLLNHEMARGLIESGLDTLWISFDGCSADMYEDIRDGANFSRLVANIKELQKINKLSPHKIKIGIAFVVMKKNIHDLKNLGRLADKIGAQKVSVSNLIPYSKNMIEQMVCERVVSESEPSCYSKHLAIDIPSIDKSELTKQPLFDLFKDYNNVTVLKNSVGSGQQSCKFIQDRCAFIRWDGVVSPCMGLLHSYKTYFSLGGLEREVTHYGLGNIKEKKLKEIWESAEYHDFREKVNDFNFSPCLQCASCDLAQKNEEDCFGNTFPTCGGCLWGQGVIQCP
jgi:MoaA/NifB/PqqE/SkfB family radical SAM enzyme